MTYNLTFIDNATLGGVITGINNASNGWMIGVLLIVTWTIVFLSFYGRVEIEDLLIGSGFIISIISGLLFTAQLISPLIIILPVVTLISGILMKYMG